MARTFSTGARLTSLALATGTLVVASGVGSASAVDVQIPKVFGGVANASSIHLEVNLPIALPLGNSGQSITSIVQDISAVVGNTALGGTNPVAVAKAVLGNGNVVLLSDLLNKVASSSLIAKLDDATGLLAPTDLLGGLIHIGLGNVVSHVAPEATATTLTSSATSRLAELKISLGNLLPTGGLSTAGIGALTDVLSTVTDTVTDTVSNVLPTITNALGILKAPATKSQASSAGALPDLSAVTGIVSNLPSVLNTATDLLGSTGDILTLGLLDSSNTITRKGAAVTSEASAGVAGLDILGGLVHLDAIKSSVKAVAGGVAGSADAVTDNTILGLKVSDLLNLKLDAINGLTGSLGGNALPSLAQGALDTVLGAVNSVLDVAGVKIQYGQKQTSKSADGRSASASTQGVGILVAPPILTSLLGGKPLVSVQLAPAAAAVNAAIVPTTPVTPVTPQTPETPATPNTPAKVTSLAHTGMTVGLPITAAVLALIAIGGLAARRRMDAGSEF